VLGASGGVSATAEKLAICPFGCIVKQECPPMLKRRPSSWEKEEITLYTHEHDESFGHEESLFSPDLSDIDRAEPTLDAVQH
jgi:hypothetical protein